MADTMTKVTPDVAKWVSAFVGLPYDAVMAGNGAGETEPASNGASSTAPEGADAPGGGGPSKTANRGTKKGTPAANDSPVLVLDSKNVKIDEHPFDPDDPFNDRPHSPSLSFKMPLPMPAKRPSNTEIIDKLQNIPQFIGSNALKYMVQVKSACAKFQKYADGEIDDFAERKNKMFEGGPLVGVLIGLVATVTLGPIGAAASEGVKLLADAV